jgi:hypothetical protein
VLALWILVVTTLHCGSGAYAFDNASISGTVTCSASAELNSQPFAAGQITVVTYGRGNFTSGSASYQLAGQPGTACNYSLSGGTYVVSTNGSGQATTSWSLTAGSSPMCTQAGISGSDFFSVASASFWGTHGSLSESGTCSRQ